MEQSSSDIGSDIVDDELINKIKKINNKLFVTQIMNDNFTLPRENPFGPIEYKRTLVECDDIKCEKYATQMQWRITQNSKNNIANYYIGVDDDGTINGLSNEEIIKCIQNFLKIISIIEASIQSINIIYTKNNNRILRINVKKKKLNDCYLTDF